MQPWQIKILELEQTALSQLDEFIAQHKLGVFLTLLYVFIALGVGLIVLLCRGQRRKPQRGRTYVPPIIIIETPAPPPPADTFELFPPPHHYRDCDSEDRHLD
jgi:hypothetical protein